MAGLQALLKQKADVNTPQGDGTTALHWAAFNDDLASARLLLTAGAKAEAVTRVGAITPLLMASRNGSAGLVAALVNAGADVNRANAEGTTPLMQAAASGSVETVRLLLDRGAVVDAKDIAHAQTPLMYAASLNRAAVVKLLLARGADSSLTTKVTKLEKMRVDIDGNPIPADGEKPAEKPAAAAETKPAATPAAAPTPADPVATLTALVQRLSARIDELEKYPYALHAGEIVAIETNPAAAAGGRGGAGRGGGRGGGGRAGDVAFLGPREVGTTVVGGMTALLFAARDGQFDALRELVAGGANVNEVSMSDKTSALVMSIINGHFDLAKYLLDHGAGANLATTAGLTPLYAAIDVQWAPHAWFPQPNTTQEKVTYIDLIKALLVHNANPNARLGKKLWFRGLAQDPSWVDPAGSTPFWRAAQSDDVAVMKLLVDCGAYPDAPSAGGDTPLMVAAGIGWMANHTANSSEQWLAAVKYCVELGADVNAADARGYTALHGAAYIGDNRMVQYLVDRGAKIDAVTKAGDTVADMANGPTRFGLPHAETVALLEKLGSKNSHNCRSDQCIPPPKEERAAHAATMVTSKPAAEAPGKPVPEAPKK
jgi:ankyrin repeat protein